MAELVAFPMMEPSYASPPFKLVIAAVAVFRQNAAAICSGRVEIATPFQQSTPDWPCVPI
ncbi:hypothetical protein [Afipia sp. GAS231]|uniref:hypothetical protein n=1 Tax=Afipia sp. GAS231 TaxID=1882747 RepID=UPI0012FB596D|nr:hypothetical protein [Afipia sp. GAS231]